MLQVEPSRIIFTILGLLVFYVDAQGFGYDGNDGPTHWGEKYQKCVGKHQSPIDIDIHNVKMVKYPTLIFENFNKHLEMVRLVNNGHTVQIAITKGKIPSIRGGPLKSKYDFSQMHFHWGNSDSEGSETLINHKGFPLELHMVFFKQSYSTIKEALNYDDGLTVLSFLYEATLEDNPHYFQFEDGLYHVTHLNSTKEIPNFVSLDKFTIKNKNVYFTYEGSLTTPPCSEVVTWIEFRHYIPVASKQIESFRKLYGEHGKLTHNFRPTQPLHNRIIKMNSGNSIRSNIHLMCLIFVSFVLSIKFEML